MSHIPFADMYSAILATNLIVTSTPQSQHVMRDVYDKHLFPTLSSRSSNRLFFKSKHVWQHFLLFCILYDGCQAGGCIWNVKN